MVIRYEIKRKLYRKITLRWRECFMILLGKYMSLDGERKYLFCAYGEASLPCNLKNTIHSPA